MDHNANLERVELRVARGSGSLLGNTLRQFAIRGSATWQPAAFRAGPKEGSFGFSGESAFNYLDFNRACLLSEDDNPVTTEKLCKFERSGDDFICDGMVLTNLGKLNVQSLEVCLIYARGARTPAQNCAVAERLVPTDAKSFVAVASKHSRTIQFSFRVVPFDQITETLEITATPGCIAVARRDAVQALQGLHI